MSDSSGGGTEGASLGYGVVHSNRQSNRERLAQTEPQAERLRQTERQAERDIQRQPERERESQKGPDREREYSNKRQG